MAWKDIFSVLILKPNHLIQTLVFRLSFWKVTHLVLGINTIFLQLLEQQLHNFDFIKVFSDRVLHFRNHQSGLMTPRQPSLAHKCTYRRDILDITVFREGRTHCPGNLHFWYLRLVQHKVQSNNHSINQNKAQKCTLMRLILFIIDIAKCPLALILTLTQASKQFCQTRRHIYRNYNKLCVSV